MNTTTENLRQDADPWRRGSDGRFGPNNRGKPPGTLNKAGKGEIDRLRARSERVWQVIDQRLAEGCVKTALFLLARMLPDQRVVELESVQPEDVAAAVADGEITIAEAAKLAATVRSLRDVEQMDDMRQRLDSIEALLAAKGRN